jgi:hypothetical protein
LDRARRTAAQAEGAADTGAGGGAVIYKGKVWGHWPYVAVYWRAGSLDEACFFCDLRKSPYHYTEVE